MQGKFEKEIKEEKKKKKKMRGVTEGVKTTKKKEN